MIFYQFRIIFEVNIVDE